MNLNYPIVYAFRAVHQIWQVSDESPRNSDSYCNIFITSSTDNSTVRLSKHKWKLRETEDRWLCTTDPMTPDKLVILHTCSIGPTSLTSNKGYRFIFIFLKIDLINILYKSSWALRGMNSTSSRNTKKNCCVDVRVNQAAKLLISLKSYKYNISFQLFLLK